jgi:D-xylose transport system ATP-binding protein
VRGLTAYDPEIETRKVLNDVSFEARAGQVLGIAGLMGAGRSELLNSIFGAWPGSVRGTVLLNGKPVAVKSPHDAIRCGMALVTEDRKRYGLILEASVAHNITLAGLDRVCGALSVINPQLEQKLCSEQIEALRIKTPSAETAVNTLSGGNQQKVVLAKCLLTQPRVLFLDEPTRGIDVGAKTEIYQIMNRLAKQGVAIVMVSSELPEVLGMSDRILVMREGRIAGELHREDATQENIMALATGAAV